MPTSFASQSEKQAMCLVFFCWTAWSVAVASHCPLQMIGWMSFLFHAFAMSHVKSHPGHPQEVCHIMISYLNLSLFQPYFQVESHECLTPLSQWLSSQESTRHCALLEKKHWGEWTNIQNILVPCEPSHFSSWSLSNFHHQTKPSRP